MDVAMLFANSVKNSANGISDTATKKQDESGEGNGFDRYLCRKYNAPTHANIANH